MAKVRVADLVATYISDILNLQEVFLLTGAGIMHLTDGLAKNSEIKPICVHHEQSASMAVEAYARANENFGVAFFSTGPAATNAITGLGGAWQDSVPCLFISGQVKRSESSFAAGVPNLRQFGVQELDILPIVDSITKYSRQIQDPESILFELDKAVYLAKEGRPGPSWLEIPMDVQAAIVETDGLPRFSPPSASEQIPESDLKLLAEALAKASRPVIVAGRGVRLSSATEDLINFVEKAGIPIVTTYLGVDVLPGTHKNNIGITGVKGDRAANLAMQNSDLLISLGSSLHVSVIGYNYQEFAREAKKVVIDIDLGAHEKSTISFDIKIKADAGEFIRGLKEIVNFESINHLSANWLSACQKWKNAYPVVQSEYEDDSNGVNIYKVIDALNSELGINDIVVSDAGSAFYATSQALKLKTKTQRYITSGGMATMGYTIPAVIGTSLAFPNNKSWGVTGDGSFQFCIQELQTIREHNLNVVIIVLNNDGYLSIRTSQENYYEGRLIGSGPSSGVTMPDTIKLAEVYGIRSMRASTIEELRIALRHASGTLMPMLIEVICPPNQAVIPTVSSKVNSDGTMSSRPLEDMFPFLPRDEYEANMFIEVI